MKTMTAAKARKILANASIVADVSGAGARYEIETPDAKTTRKVLAAFKAEGVYLGGYTCGWGGSVLSETYRTDGKCYSDPSSRSHY